eukprot:TRINITY_DN706_c0_g1_i1.p2 TRINITY_DN706_c0_g1~~TRINITY_DN706_c0_g1_i1.p2  ORF type:complete len:171 (-),score=58.58 TRINITY_DN706_c0_g1_i1:156-668(-)
MSDKADKKKEKKVSKKAAASPKSDSSAAKKEKKTKKIKKTKSSTDTTTTTSTTPSTTTEGEAPTTPHLVDSNDEVHVPDLSKKPKKSILKKEGEVNEARQGLSVAGIEDIPEPHTEIKGPAVVEGMKGIVRKGAKGAPLKDPKRVPGSDKNKIGNGSNSIDNKNKIVKKT